MFRDEVAISAQAEPFQYSKSPRVSVIVDTSVRPSKEISREEVETVKAPPTLERPEPVRSVNASLLILRFVVNKSEIELDELLIRPPVKVTNPEAVSS